MDSAPSTPPRAPHQRATSFTRPLGSPHRAVSASSIPPRPTMSPARPAVTNEDSARSSSRIQQPASTSSQQSPSRPTSRHPASSSQSASQRAASVRMRPQWTSSPEAKFRVFGVPWGWHTIDIHRAMLPLGNVTYIDIPRDRDGTMAYVTFTPPSPQVHQAYRDGFAVSVAETGRQTMLRFEHVVNNENKSAQRDLECRFSSPAARLDFGVMKEPEVMLGMHTVRSTPLEMVELVVDSGYKQLELAFCVPSVLMTKDRLRHKLPESMQYRLRCNFAQIQSISQTQDMNSGEVALIICVEAPPLLFRKTDDLLDSHEEDGTRWSEKKLWYRHTEIEQDQDVAKMAVRQLQRESPIIDVGRWLTYRVTLDAKMSASSEYRKLCDVLEAHGVALTHRQISAQFAATKAMAMWSWLDSPVAALEEDNANTKELSFLSDLQQMAHQTIQLPFAVRYALESCISHGCLHECNIDQAFLERLSTMATESEHSLVRTVKLLEKVVDEGHRFYEPMQIFKRVVPNMRNAFKQKQQAANFVKVLTATVTPTAIFFNTPALEPSNRVVRHFRQHADRFLRVSFSDEKYKGKIYGRQEDSQELEVFTRIKRTMNNGIKIGDRIYDFLAFGNSQFKDHGAYFFASIGDLNAQKIRDWMGDFEHIKVVAKYCSRLGQAFTTTRSTHSKSYKEIRIPDIERNGFCFTDGVGKVSPMLATLISSEVGMLTPNAGVGKTKDCPSAFQFRMGGCKGILVVDPTMQSDLSVAIRPSQEKFAMMKHTGLEICRISQFTSASLNVQIILILSALGVEDPVFLEMMANMLSDIELAMTDESKAIELLQKNIDQNQMTVQLAQMILDGFMNTQDPFMLSCMRLWRSWSLKYLKEKQRMFVEDGAFVLGCIDETATLEGHSNADPSFLPEVFLQIPDRSPERKGQWKVLEGICMLARNPSLHPGDIRVVRAVACDKLMHIRDCVVLPQKGDRDIANMCSGGDLDGDDYLVIWDPALLPREWNHPPMDYRAPEPRKADGKITVNHMTSFFVTHMKYDNLGPIATAHKCWGDSEEEGVKSDKCVELAGLHSMAVDYAKTGEPAKMPRRLQMDRKPHWHEGAKKTYQSKKVIGKLYDMVKKVDFVPVWDLPFDERILKAYDDLDEAILEQARDVKAQYDEAVRRLMAKFSIKSEFEVWSTFVLEHNNDYNDYKFSEKIGEEVYTIKDFYRNLCHQHIADDEAGQRDPEKRGRWVAAMYAVTASEVGAAVEQTKETKMVGGAETPEMEMTLETMPFMSFPWLFPEELGRIATKRSGGYSGNVLERTDSLLPRKPTGKGKAKLVNDLLDEVPELPPLHELNLYEDEEQELGAQLPQRLGAVDLTNSPWATTLSMPSPALPLESLLPAPVETGTASHDLADKNPAAADENTEPGRVDVVDGDDEEGEEGEEVVLQLPTEPSAFDELEKLLEG